MWCLPYINTPQRFHQWINITGCAQRRNRTSLWLVSLDFQNRQKHAWIDIQQQPSLVEQISKQQRPLQGYKGDVQSPMSSVEDSKPFDDLAWTSVEKHQGPWPCIYWQALTTRQTWQIIWREETAPRGYVAGDSRIQTYHDGKRGWVQLSYDYTCLLQFRINCHQNYRSNLPSIYQVLR
jgi:hypothetical protein